MYQATREIIKNQIFYNIHLEAHIYILETKPSILMVLDIIYYAVPFYLAPQYNIFVLLLADFTHCTKQTLF